MDEAPHPRTWLTITEKGRKVTEKVREAQTVLEEL